MIAAALMRASSEHSASWLTLISASSPLAAFGLALSAAAVAVFKIEQLRDEADEPSDGNAKRRLGEAVKGVQPRLRCVVEDNYSADECRNTSASSAGKELAGYHCDKDAEAYRHGT
jgi:hypothetical protein